MSKIPFGFAASFVLSLLAVVGAPSASLRSLEISEKNVNLLDHLASYPDLEMLSISCVENLESLPDSLGKLRRLRELRIDNGNGCSMNPVLPENIGDLRLLEKLTLYGAQDPGDAGHQPRTRHKFPSSMSQLKNLTFLDLGRNGLSEIPMFVGELSNLRELRFQWNITFREIPSFVSNLREVSTLKLDGNDLTDLPDFLNRLPKLTRVTLGNNCRITQNAAKMHELQNRFPKVRFDFTDEYDCPAK